MDCDNKSVTEILSILKDVYPTEYNMEWHI